MKKSSGILLYVVLGVAVAAAIAGILILELAPKAPAPAAPAPPVTAPADTAEVSPDAVTGAVMIVTAGAGFSPAVELAEGSEAAINWTVNEGGASYTGTSPTINFGSEAVRHVRMTAAYPDGSDALGDIVTFNIGFDSVQDAGKYNIGPGYNHPTQYVAGLAGVNNMTGLVRFLAATPSLRGDVDFSGLSRLEYIECFGAKLSSVDLSGCGSLIRLCVENNDLSYLDLNPVSGPLRDLRLSGNRSTVALEPLASPLSRLYHYCAQSITITGHPTAEQLPAIEEWWDWNSDQSGALVIRSGALRSVMTSGNTWTSADLTGQFPAGSNGYLDAHGCLLSSVTLAGCQGLSYLDLHDNRLDGTAVDALLAEVVSWGTYGGTLDLSGNAAPSYSGNASLATLVSRNWTVAAG
jgi:hypothetical protein